MKIVYSFLLILLLALAAWLSFLWFIKRPYMERNVVGSISALTIFPCRINVKLPSSDQGVWELGLNVKGEAMNNKDLTIAIAIENLSPEMLYVRDGVVDIAIPFKEKKVVYVGSTDGFIVDRHMIFNKEIKTLHMQLELSLDKQLKTSQSLEVLFFKMRPTF